MDQQHKSYDFEICGAKVFATSNDITRLSKPLQCRFRRLHLPPYAEEQFLDVAVKVCGRLKESTARIIGAQVWGQKGDIRDVISINKLVRKDDEPHTPTHTVYIYAATTLRTLLLLTRSITSRISRSIYNNSL